MKLYLNEEAKAYLEDLLNTQDEGRYLSEVMNAYLSSPHGEEEAAIKEAISKAKSEPAGIRAGYLDFLGGEDPDFLEIAPKYHLGDFVALDARKFRDNPYFKLLRGVKDHVKDVTLNWLSYAPYELFLSDEIHAEGENYQEVSPFAYFKDGFSFPALYKKNHIWMSLIPHEILTMERDIEQAHGNVVTLGLGLGYYAFMVSQKENVQSVKIVENDPAVIALFKKSLLPLFPHKEKIEFIQEDAIRFLKKTDPKTIDHCFADLWHNEEDGLPIYLSLRDNEEYKGHRLTYWIERSILCYLRRFVITLLYEEYEELVDEYLPSKDPNEQLFYRIHKALEDIELKTKEDIKTLLSDESLRKLAAKI